MGLKMRMWFLAYIISVAGANLITAVIHPLELFGLIIPSGTIFIGLTFLLRNMVQIRGGRLRVYGAIAVGLIVSAVSSRLLGDTISITVASAISFLVSESLDTEIFSRLKRKVLYLRVLSGGGVGSVLDSTIFVILGLSPIGIGFVTWSEIPMAIIGQLGVKVAMQALGGIVIAKVVTTLPE